MASRAVPYVVPPDPALVAGLRASYRRWWEFREQERVGAPPPVRVLATELAAIRAAEARLGPHQADTVYRAAKAAYGEETGRCGGCLASVPQCACPPDLAEPLP